MQNLRLRLPPSQTTRAERCSPDRGGRESSSPTCPYLSGNRKRARHTGSSSRGSMQPKRPTYSGGMRLATPPRGTASVILAVPQAVSMRRSRRTARPRPSPRRRTEPDPVQAARARLRTCPRRYARMEDAVALLAESRGRSEGSLSRSAKLCPQPAQRPDRDRRSHRPGPRPGACAPTRDGRAARAPRAHHPSSPADPWPWP